MSRNKHQRFKGRGAFRLLTNHLERRFIIVIFVLIELRVFFVTHLRSRFFPKRNHTVERFIFCYGFIFILAAVFQLAMLGKHTDRITDIVAVFFNQAAKVIFLQVVAVSFIIGVKFEINCNDRTGSFFFAGSDGVPICTLGLPAERLIDSVHTALNSNFFCYHKCGIESDTELTDNVNLLTILVLGIIFKIKGTALGNGAEIIFQFFFGHAAAVIRNSQSASGLICCQTNFIIIVNQLHGIVCQRTIIELINGITCI